MQERQADGGSCGVKQMQMGLCGEMKEGQNPLRPYGEIEDEIKRDDNGFF